MMVLLPSSRGSTIYSFVFYHGFLRTKRLTRNRPTSPAFDHCALVDHAGISNFLEMNGYGKCRPEAVNVKRPFLTPLIAIKESASFRTCAVIPRTRITSMQLS